MVEVDVFWAYGFGAGFATAATYQLAKGRGKVPGEHSLWASRYTMATVLFCAVIFAPSGAWLLSAFPDWETMQVARSLDDLPAWLVTLFAITNVTQGILGYFVARVLIERGKPYLAFLQMCFAYVGFFFILVHGWDGRGYQRFFSADREVFGTWPVSPDFGDSLSRVGEWLGSPVALTLLGMGVVLIPAVAWPMITWLRDGQTEAVKAGQLDRVRGGATSFGLVLLAIFGVGLATAIVASVLIHLLGWWVGVPVALVLAYVAMFRTRIGLAWHIYRWLGLPGERAARPAETSIRTKEPAA